jgi:hypothetical protein
MSNNKTKEAPKGIWELQLFVQMETQYRVTKITNMENRNEAIFEGSTMAQIQTPVQVIRIPVNFPIPNVATLEEAFSVFRELAEKAAKERVDELIKQQTGPKIIDPTAMPMPPIDFKRGGKDGGFHP